MARVELEHVDKVYPGGTRALSDLTLAIDDGELVVLVGPSGCGKSTVLRLIAGLEEATAGTIRIGERVVNELRPQERNVAMVFQDYALYPYLSARGNRVAVLDKGRLQQVAPPRELYERPTNVFVAGFIGNPPMNLFPTRLSTDDRGRVVMRVGSETLPVSPGAGVRLRASLESPLTAGVRPEALRVERGEPGDGAVRATVEHVEYLGHETLAHVSVEGDAVRLVARVEGMLGFEKGQPVGLLVDPSAVHLFDGNGRSLGG